MVADRRARWAIADILVPIAVAPGCVGWGVPYRNGVSIEHPWGHGRMLPALLAPVRCGAARPVRRSVETRRRRAAACRIPRLSLAAVASASGSPVFPMKLSTPPTPAGILA